MRSAREEVRDLERVRFVTENYEELQGLTRVAVGLVILAACAFFVFTRFEVTSKFVADIVVTLSVVIGGVMVFVYYRIKRYYRLRYGQVQTFPRLFRLRRLYVGGVVMVVLVLAYFLTAWLADVEVPETAAFFLMFFGALEAVDRWPERRFRPHHIVLNASMAVAGLVLWVVEVVWGYSSFALQGGLLGSYFVLLMVVGGFMDHLLLVRTMKTLPEEGDG